MPILIYSEFAATHCPISSHSSYSDNDFSLASGSSSIVLLQPPRPLTPTCHGELGEGHPLQQGAQQLAGRVPQAEEEAHRLAVVQLRQAAVLLAHVLVSHLGSEGRETNATVNGTAARMNQRSNRKPVMQFCYMNSRFYSGARHNKVGTVVNVCLGFSRL